MEGTVCSLPSGHFPSIHQTQDGMTDEGQGRVCVLAVGCHFVSQLIFREVPLLYPSCLHGGTNIMVTHEGWLQVPTNPFSFLFYLLVYLLSLSYLLIFFFILIPFSFISSLLQLIR